MNIFLFKLGIVFITLKIGVQDIQILVITVGEGKFFGGFSSACGAVSVYVILVCGCLKDLNDLSNRSGIL